MHYATLGVLFVMCFVDKIGLLLNILFIVLFSIHEQYISMSDGKGSCLCMYIISK
jgi:hypothetical protein